MKKYSWIAALLLALTVIFIGCGVDPIEPPKPEKEPLIVEAKDIVLKPMGSTFGSGTEGTGDYAGTKVDKNKFILIHGGSARAGSVGFGLEFPKGYEDYNYVIVGFKITKFADGAVTLTTKKNSKMEAPDGYEGNWTSVAVDGHTQYSNGFAVGTGLAKGEEGTSPPMKLSLFDGSIWYQFNSYSEDYEGAKNQTPNNALAAQPNQNWAVEVTNVYFTSTPEVPGEEEVEPFVPVTKVELKEKSVVKGSELKLQAIITPIDATNQKVTWSIKSFKTLAGNVITDATLLSKVDFKVVDNNSGVDGSVWTGTSKSPDTIVAVEAGTVTVVAIVVNGTETGVNYVEKNLDITVKGLKEGAKKNVTIDTTAAGIDVSTGYDGGAGGTISAVTSNGFTFAQIKNYQQAYVQFKVNLDTLSGTTGATIADISKVYFTFEAVSGDVGYKRPQLWASNAKLEGAQNGKQPIIHAGTGATDQTKNKDDPLYVLTNNTFVVDASKVKEGINDGSGVFWFVIMIDANETGSEGPNLTPNAATTYKVSSISFTFWEVDE